MISAAQTAAAKATCSTLEITVFCRTYASGARRNITLFKRRRKEYVAHLWSGRSLVWSRTSACHADDPGSNLGDRTINALGETTLLPFKWIERVGLVCIDYAERLRLASASIFSRSLITFLPFFSIFFSFQLLPAGQMLSTTIPFVSSYITG